MTASVLAPARRVFCQDRREDGAPCTRLTHTDQTHVGGDGDDWTDNDTEETP